MSQFFDFGRYPEWAKTFITGLSVPDPSQQPDLETGAPVPGTQLRLEAGGTTWNPLVIVSFPSELVSLS